MTVRELKWALAAPHIDDDAEVRVVCHGFERPSFNLPAAAAQQGPNADYLVIVEEARP